MTKGSKSGLYDLHGMIVDSRKGFAQAARHATDVHVSGFLRVLSAERHNIGAELGRLLPEMDAEEPRGKGTFLGGLHRAWMHLHTTVRANGNAALLAACARGEKSLLMRYDHLLATDGFSMDARRVLQRQRALVKDQRERVKQLHTQFRKFEK